MTNDKYVGMDAHVATITAEVLNGNGRVVSRSIMEANPEQIKDYFRGMSGVVHVTFEEGTQAALSGVNYFSRLTTIIIPVSSDVP